MDDRAYFGIAVAIYGLCSVYAFFLWRRGFRRDERISYLLLLAAFAFHTVALFQRGFSYNRCPVSNLYEAITFLLWSITATYLIIGLWPRFRFVGAFASPALFCIGVFALFPDLDTHGDSTNLLKGWTSLHASLILLAYGAFGLASVAGAMYLTQEHDLKRRKSRAALSLLPSMGRLEKTLGRLLIIGFTLLTVGLALGGYTLRTQGTTFTFWDTKIVWSLFVWLLYLVLLVLHLRFSQRGHRIAWGAVGSFGFVLLTFWGTNLLSQIHTPKPEAQPTPPVAGQSADLRPAAASPSQLAWGRPAPPSLRPNHEPA